MGIIDLIGFLIHGVGIRGIIFWIFISFMILDLPCNLFRYIFLLFISIRLALKPISRFLAYIRTGKHKIHLQMNTLTAFPVIAGNPIDQSLNLIYKDFINSALPEIMRIAKEGDEVIVKTHLIPEKLIKKLPNNPEVREIKPGILSESVNITIAAVSFLIRKYINKLNKGSLLKYLSKLKKHKYYIIIWRK